MSVAAVAAETLAAIRARGTHRRMRVLEGAQAPRMIVDRREVLLFAGSNYLDLAAHPEVTEAAARAARDWGCAAGGSRLINGNLALHERLEEALADFLGVESALVFSTGYQANLGVIPCLVGPGDVVVEAAPRARRTLVVLDGVYSMDGDLAPLPALLEVARRHGALVLLDDAHGIGCLGAGGRGTAEALGVAPAELDVLVGTLGKALGSF